MSRQVFVLLAAALLLVLSGCAAPAATVAPTSAPAAPAATDAPLATGQTRFEIVPDKSEARYRVREQIANRSLPSDAIGRTNAISGALVIDQDGKVVNNESKFVVDASTLKSDESRRDNFLRQNVLQTSQFPTFDFVPTAVSGLPSPIPASGDGSFELTGDLTIRGVTHPVTWQVTATYDGQTIQGTATTSFTFKDFSIPQPRVPLVLSIEDTIKLELDLTLTRA